MKDCFTCKIVVTRQEHHHGLFGGKRRNSRGENVKIYAILALDVRAGTLEKEN